MINGAVEKLVVRGDRRVRVGLAGPGKAFGYEGLIDGLPSPITAVTRERSLLLVLQGKLFEQLFNGEDAISRGLLGAIHKDLAAAVRETLRPCARLAAAGSSPSLRKRAPGPPPSRTVNGWRAPMPGTSYLGGTPGGRHAGRHDRRRRHAVHDRGAGLVVDCQLVVVPEPVVADVTVAVVAVVAVAPVVGVVTVVGAARSGPWSSLDWWLIPSRWSRWSPSCLSPGGPRPGAWTAAAEDTGKDARAGPTSDARDQRGRRQTTGDRTPHRPSAHQADLTLAGNRGDDQGTIAGDLSGPDPGVDAAGDAADPSAAMVVLQGRDRHLLERRSDHRLTLRVDLYSAHTDPELRQSAIGTLDSVDPVDHDRDSAVWMSRDRVRRGRARRAEHDHRGRAGAGDAEGCAGDDRQTPART